MDGAMIVGLTSFVVIIVVMISIFILRRMKGSIKIKFDEPFPRYYPGDKITGKLLIRTKKPIHAKELNVSLVAEIKTRGGKRSRYRNHTIVENVLLKDASLSPDEASYPFSLNVPLDVYEKLRGNPILHNIISSVGALMGYWRNIRWYVKSHLVCDGLDLIGSKSFSFRPSRDETKGISG